MPNYIENHPKGWFFVIVKYLTVVYTLVIMSNTTVLNIKIDKTLKEQAQQVAKALGLPVSTLVSASLKDIIRTRSVTFSVEPQFRPEVIKSLLKSSENAKKGIDVSPGFDNLTDAFGWLDTNLG